MSLLLYAGAILLGTLIHEPLLLAVGMGVVVVLAGERRWRILRKALVAIMAFNVAVTLSYVLVAALQGTFSFSYILLINLRVLFLTSLTFLFVARVNVFRALAFSPALAYLLSLACGQAMTLARVAGDFRLALRSRLLARPPLRERYRQVAGMSVLLLDKALYQGAEITQAMRSRGFFDD